MAIHTQASLKRLFAASRARNEKKKQQEQLKYRKAQEAVKKALAKQQSIKDKETPQNYWKQPQIEFSRIITIYNSRYIEKFIGEDDLYTTREELENAEPNNINWRLWDSIVNKTRKELNIK